MPEWTTLAVLNWTSQRFADAGQPSARLDAQLLLGHVLNCTKVQLYTQFDKPLTDDELARYRELIRRRLAGEPVAYLLGSREFWGRAFEVTRDVLIPRPETEFVIERVRAHLPDRAGAYAIADVCTGSGAIAVTLAAEFPQAQVVATDLSAPALEVAKRNADHHGVATRMRWAHGDGLAALDATVFDVVVANPPYVTVAEMGALAPEVRHEPALALVAGADGMQVLAPLIAGASAHLRPGGLCAVEHGAGQGDAVRAWFVANPAFTAPTTDNDLAGHPRVTWAVRVALALAVWLGLPGSVRADDTAAAPPIAPAEDPIADTDWLAAPGPLPSLPPGPPGPPGPPVPPADPVGAPPPDAPPPPSGFDGLAADAPPRKLTKSEREAIRAACRAETDGCDPVALLGGLERDALRQALRQRGLVIAQRPWGLPVGHIHVVNHDVFGPKDGFLRVFNFFHRTTREHVVEREVILRPGEPWTQSRVDETARRLRDPVFSVLAFVVPVQGRTPGTVDVLVVTRDVWSLRLNTDYRYQDGTFTYLTFALSENNLLGLRTFVAATFEMDQGSAGIGPVLLDPNLAGKRIELFARVYALVGRETLFGPGAAEVEGSTSAFRLQRPLWSLASKWGAGIEFSHRYAIERSFRQTGLRTYDAPETPEDDQVPWTYRQRRALLVTSLTRGFGDDVEHRLKVGHRFEVQRPSLLDDITLTPVVEAAFARDVLPRSERLSSLFASYEAFTPTYREVRNVTTYDVAEDVRLGPTLAAGVSTALAVLGSETNLAAWNLSAGYQGEWAGDGFWRVAASASARVTGDGVRDATASALARVITPMMGLARGVAEVRATTMWNDTQNSFLTLGGDNGLRGYGINEFEGQRRIVGQLEARTAPVTVGFLRGGLVAFYDAGAIAETVGQLRLRHNLGAGFRLLIPQLSAQLFRVDLAVPLAGAGGPRVVAGFSSEF